MGVVAFSAIGEEFEDFFSFGVGAAEFTDLEGGVRTDLDHLLVVLVVGGFEGKVGAVDGSADAIPKWLVVVGGEHGLGEVPLG